MNQWPPNGITGRPHRGLSAARATEGCHGSHGVGQLMELRTPPAELSKASPDAGSAHERLKLRGGLRPDPAEAHRQGGGI